MLAVGLIGVPRCSIRSLPFPIRGLLRRIGCRGASFTLAFALGEQGFCGAAAAIGRPPVLFAYSGGAFVTAKRPPLPSATAIGAARIRAGVFFLAGRSHRCSCIGCIP